MREVVNLLIGYLPPAQMGLVLEGIEEEILGLQGTREEDWGRKIEDLTWVQGRVDDELRAWEEA